MRIRITGLLSAVVLVCCVAPAHGQDGPAVLGPDADSGLRLVAPIDRWDEAVPLGNGLLGGLLWGGGSQLKLSLDRGDLWDSRIPEILKRPDWNYATIKRLVAEKNQAKMVEMFDAPYNAFPYPTKIPAGRLEIALDAAQSAERFSLDLRKATGRVDVTGNGRVEVFYSAVEPVALLRVTGPAPTWKIVPPASLNRLGYNAPTTGTDAGVSWSLQQCAGELQYAVVVAQRRDGESTLLAVTVASTADDADPVALGRRRVEAALAAGYDEMFAEHAAWWAEFWARSGVRVPDAAIQAHYDLVRYFHGAASRRGAPPVPLQGVWTADAGGLPPWHGDYHHDTNTQMTYWAYQTAGHFDEGAAFLDFMWDLLPKHREFARTFYDAPGAAVPGVMTLDGSAMGGWGQYSLSPVQGAWVAQSFYWHWRYTMDRKFLADRAYPYCVEIAECLAALLEADESGKLKLPLSTSPEIHNNSMAAWLTPNTNNDLALLHWLFGALAEMARDLNDAPAAERWAGLLGKLDDLAVEGEAGPLRLAPDQSLAGSHRHHSHLMAIHPLGTLHVEGTDRDRKIIAASLEQTDRLGTSAWVGFSFGWYSCMAARCGDSDRALEHLDAFVKAFISRNGFNQNGDFKRLGYSNFSYRPFTLEANFAACQAVQEMLLQSWGGTVRVFPAVPNEWADVSFDSLRAEGAFVVSARRTGGVTRRVSIRSVRGGTLVLRDPFAGAAPAWNRADVTRVGNDFRCELKPGEALDGHIGR